jgi:hypothetical protein
MSALTPPPASSSAVALRSLHFNRKPELPTRDALRSHTPPSCDCTATSPLRTTPLAFAGARCSELRLTPFSDSVTLPSNPDAVGLPSIMHPPRSLSGGSALMGTTRFRSALGTSMEARRCSSDGVDASNASRSVTAPAARSGGGNAVVNEQLALVPPEPATSASIPWRESLRLPLSAFPSSSHTAGAS